MGMGHGHGAWDMGLRASPWGMGHVARRAYNVAAVTSPGDFRNISHVSTHCVLNKTPNGPDASVWVSDGRSGQCQCQCQCQSSDVSKFPPPDRHQTTPVLYCMRC
jgi:hypothetical protein